MKVRKLLVLALVPAASLTACPLGGGNVGEDLATQALNCCDNLGDKDSYDGDNDACDILDDIEIGWEKRAGISFNARQESLRTFEDEKCVAIADAEKKLWECLAAAQCNDIDEDDQRVKGCDDLAEALCEARVDVGDKDCGGNGLDEDVECDENGADEAYFPRATSF